MLANMENRMKSLSAIAVTSITLLSYGTCFAADVPIHLETNWLAHTKTSAQCVEAAKAAFRDSYYPQLISDQGPKGVYVGDSGKIFVVRCDVPSFAFIGAAYYPWPQLGDVDTQTMSGALQKYLK